MRKKMILATVLFSMTFFSPGFSLQEQDAEKIVRETVAKETTIDGQAAALIELAWFDKTASKEVPELAKKKLKEFGRWAKPMLNKYIVTAPASVQKEMMPYLIWAYEEGGTSHDRDYLATCIYLLKTAERDVKILAMDAMTVFPIREGYLPVIDAAYEDPSLELRAIRTLGFIANPKSTDYLMEKIASPDKDVADAAEQALLKMAPNVSLQIKKGLLDDRQNVRERCLRIFLNIAAIEDVSLLSHLQLKSDQFSKPLRNELQKKIHELDEAKAKLEKEAEEAEKAATQEDTIE